MSLAKETPNNAGQTRKRAMCFDCTRPKKTCLCDYLPPDRPIHLKTCRIIVLQHPHEAKMKNRSLPLLEFSLAQYSNEYSDNEAATLNRKVVKKGRGEDIKKQQQSSYDWSMAVVTGRRLSDEVDPFLLDLIRNPTSTILVFPFSYYSGAGNSIDNATNVLSLTEGVAKLQERKRKITENDANWKRDYYRINFVFIDATWKYAKEMVRANDEGHLWPSDLIRVKLAPPCSECGGTDSNQEKQYVPHNFKPLRFASVRTPPNCSSNAETTKSSDFLSTAECIAWVASYVEDSPGLYDKLMKPLDAMVEQWNIYKK